MAKNKTESGFAPSWCVHFRPMSQHETCKEDIGYTALNGGAEYRRMHRLPCFIQSGDKPGQRLDCERFRAPTVEEIALHAQLPVVRASATADTLRYGSRFSVPFRVTSR